jgi:hypothetical protein
VRVPNQRPSFSARVTVSLAKRIGMQLVVQMMAMKG